VERNLPKNTPHAQGKRGKSRGGAGGRVVSVCLKAKTGRGKTPGKRTGDGPGKGRPKNKGVSGDIAEKVHRSYTGRSVCKSTPLKRGRGNPEIRESPSVVTIKPKEELCGSKVEVTNVIALGGEKKRKREARLARARSFIWGAWTWVRL